VDRAAKKEMVATLSEVFKASNVVVVAHYAGLTVAQMQTLRRQAKQAGASVKVAKNRPPKVVSDFAKANEKLVILGGALGSTVLDANGVKALASLPSLDELRAKIVGLIQAPATKIAQVITAPAAKVARVVHAYSAKGE